MDIILAILTCLAGVFFVIALATGWPFKRKKKK
jgi:hypothetical protein